MFIYISSPLYQIQPIIWYAEIYKIYFIGLIERELNSITDAYLWEFFTVQSKRQKFSLLQNYFYVNIHAVFSQKNILKIFIRLFFFFSSYTADKVCRGPKNYGYAPVNLPQTSLTYYIDLNYYLDKQILVRKLVNFSFKAFH